MCLRVWRDVRSFGVSVSMERCSGVSVCEYGEM